MLTLKEIRKLVEETKDEPETLPVVMCVPTQTYIDDQGKEMVDVSEIIEAEHIILAEEPLFDDSKDDAYIMVSTSDAEVVQRLCPGYVPERL